MLFSWPKRRRRRKLLATPFPKQWLDILRFNVAAYGSLNLDEQARLRDDLRVLIAEKHWEGCGGLNLTDEIKVTIAAQAALLLLGLDHDYYHRVLSILVYPAGYRPSQPVVGADGVVRDAGGRLGEAWYRGPVILSWADAQAGGRSGNDGMNVVLHEFAHQLDFEDRAADGTPPLRSREQYQRWQEVMASEYRRLVTDAERGRLTLLDTYGASDPTEFFAVATECFFERSVEMQHQHLELYSLLRDYYRQDPAARIGEGRGKL